MELGYSYPRPTTGRIESATHIQTPSQAEHGLGGVLFFHDNRFFVSMREEVSLLVLMSVVDQTAVRTT